jgi:hypothetical protein
VTAAEVLDGRSDSEAMSLEILELGDTDSLRGAGDVLAFFRCELVCAIAAAVEDVMTIKSATVVIRFFIRDCFYLEAQNTREPSPASLQVLSSYQRLKPKGRKFRTFEGKDD